MPGRPEHSDKMKACVQALLDKGEESGSAYAICTTSLEKAGTPIFAEETELPNTVRQLHVLGATGTVRLDTLDGREHLVVPVVALMEGVIHAVNAQTPELVPLSSLAVAPQGWNGRPLMFGHPNRNGVQISANDPAVLAAHSFGRVFNTKLNGKKLTMEAWIDPVKAAEIGGQAMIDRIRAGQMIEVSVGAFVTTKDGEGTHNGKRYLATWDTIVPDHLAFLENKKGACSIEMGCGSCRTAELLVAEAEEYVEVEGLEEADLEDLVGNGNNQYTKGNATKTKSDYSDSREPTEQETAASDNDHPDHVVTTGMTSDQGATHLHIWHVGDNTVVSHLGEQQNSEDVAFNGKLSPEKVLAKYRREMTRFAESAEPETLIGNGNNQYTQNNSSADQATTAARTATSAAGKAKTVLAHVAAAKAHGEAARAHRRAMLGAPDTKTAKYHGSMALKHSAQAGKHNDAASTIGTGQAEDLMHGLEAGDAELEALIGDVPGHEFHGNQYTSTTVDVTDEKKGLAAAKKHGLDAQIVNTSGPGGGNPEMKISGKHSDMTKFMKEQGYDIEAHTFTSDTKSDTTRDDLQSSFSASLSQAKSMTPKEMSKSPALTARVIIEGALEEPHSARELFDKASKAFNSMPEHTSKLERAKTEALKNFRFALTRERQRAESSAPKRWSKVQDSLGPKNAAEFETLTDLKAAGPFPDKSQVENTHMKLGDTVVVNKPGHPRHGKKGVVADISETGAHTVASPDKKATYGQFLESELKHAQAVQTVAQVGDRLIVALKTAGYYDTPTQADSEEAAELVSYQTLRALCDQLDASYGEISDLVDALVSAEENETANTPDEEAAETELETAQLEAIRTLCGSAFGTLQSVITLVNDQLAPEDGAVAPMPLGRYMATKMMDCPTCDGTGTVDGSTCPTCDGEGEVKAGRYAEREKEAMSLIAQARAARNISQKMRDKLPESDFAGPGTSFPIAKPEDVAAAAHSIGRAKGNPDEIKSNIIAIAYRKGGAFIDQLPEDWKKKKADQKAAAASTLEAACGCGEGKMTKEAKDEAIKLLIANKHSGFVAGDEAMLEAASDDRIESFMVAAGAREKEVKALEESRQPKTLSEEDWMKVAPAEIKSLITRTQRQETERKAELVAGLKVAQSEYSESELSGMSLELLERMARLAKLEEEPMPANYMGRGLPRSATTNPKADDVYANPPDPYADALKALQANQASRR